ncbi:hypothetical protein NLJ89_g5683 [Agrocybe chaxingu]|uniref:ABC transporter domain-containing protein n=1 Tax=Agrocybe chaxingu TaxID=84603 RepID=A0A9W8MWQ3_9AGAR|nr:hypothetical protein NLJ89_g5683 [Agrocybe chaxingu]
MKNDSKQTVNANESKRDEIIVDEAQYGVWTLRVARSVQSRAEVYWNELKMAYPLFVRLLTDIYSVSPTLSNIFIACNIWDGTQDALRMHLSSSLLLKIEAGVISGVPDARGIATSVVLQLLCSTAFAYIGWHNSRALRKLKTEVTQHFKFTLMKEATSSSDISANDAWGAISKVISFFTELFKIASQLLLILHLSRTSGGLTFVLICVVKPVFSAMTYTTWLDKVCFAYASNTDFRRMMSLGTLAKDSYRQGVVSHNLGAWIIKEYQKIRKALAGITDEHPYYYFSRRDTPTYDMFAEVLGNLPIAHCAILAIFRPSAFSVASIAILQQSAVTLRYSLENIFRSAEEFRGAVHSIRRTYETTEVLNLMEDGDLAYPRVDEKEDWNGEKGMSFELKYGISQNPSSNSHLDSVLRDITFAYRGSEKNSNALNGISLRIKPGQLVVVVGANGSGKSTLIRILSRLYDPTDGTVLIDGRPSKDYRVRDLHRATTILSQENYVYPLTFANRREHRAGTILNAHVTHFHNNLHGNRGHPLMGELKKTTDISGGEKQRIVAARSFMRFKSGKIKFVAVDEPSAALDAVGELHLFNRLVDMRQGKTMVFVTHRFGHLTKHADLIVCMKDGLIVETGTHPELMEKNGGYAKLYDIQAQAFAN